MSSLAKIMPRLNAFPACPGIRTLGPCSASLCSSLPLNSMKKVQKSGYSNRHLLLPAMGFFLRNSTCRLPGPFAHGVEPRLNLAASRRRCPDPLPHPTPHLPTPLAGQGGKACKGRVICPSPPARKGRGPSPGSRTPRSSPPSPRAPGTLPASSPRPRAARSAEVVGRCDNVRTNRREGNFYQVFAESARCPGRHRSEGSGPPAPRHTHTHKTPAGESGGPRLHPSRLKGGWVRGHPLTCSLLMAGRTLSGHLVVT